MGEQKQLTHAEILGYLEELQSLISKSDEESITLMSGYLINVAEFVKNVGEEISALNAQVNDLISENQGLIKANNKYFRQITLNRPSEDEENKDPKEIEKETLLGRYGA